MGKTRKRVTKLRRPRERAECKGGERPCPWVSCRYHLYLDVNVTTGSIKFNFPDRELWEMEQSCALDLADRGELTFEEVGNCMNLTRERIRQMTVECLGHLHARLAPEEIAERTQREQRTRRCD